VPFGSVIGPAVLALYFIPYIGMILAAVFVSPISMIYVIVLYFDRRRCRENYTTLNLKREIAALMRKRIQQI